MNEVPDEWQGIRLPIINNIKPSTISDEIISMTAEETRDAMGKIFKTFEELTGKKVVIETKNELPINVLLPKK